MSTSEVTKEGVRGQRPDREAVTGSAATHRRGRGRGGDRPVVPRAEFRSYYGRPILNQIPWSARDIGGYLFLGGLAGASSVLAGGAELTGRPALARAMKVTALGAVSGSVAALIHDLGRPERFLNMLRVVKPTSPMSVGSWLLATYGPMAGAAAACDVTGRLRPVGRAATVGAGVVGPAVAAYTAPLVCDTAVPAWHDGYREMPFVFVGSGAAAAAGMGMIAAPVRQAAPARRAAVLGAGLEVAAAERMRARMGMLAEPYERGRGGRLLRAATALSLGGAAAGALVGQRSRAVAAVAGVALLAGSACTRFAIFQAGVDSARDPTYTVVPQRQRLEVGAAEQ
ncbi:NrfD/PsrC family molybdoenzyme membrane anchor subunit [Salinactinospora qingdaonensis]|uniref:Polysulfide reductase NrfD n=1 Tax=Salinactinospora qingdaonensis TaxID=702744 RepID=A0ABP7FBP5_9ACTN